MRHKVRNLNNSDYNYDGSWLPAKLYVLLDVTATLPAQGHCLSTLLLLILTMLLLCIATDVSIIQTACVSLSQKNTFTTRH